MKNTFFIVILLVLSLTCFSQIEQEKTSEVTTYYFIRHAEKDRTNPNDKNPKLTKAGLKRADTWRDILNNIDFDAVYSTDYYRTIETARPTAKENNLDIRIYDPKNLNSTEEFLNETRGKTVLVVGHSNTIPDFVNTVIKQKKYKDISDNTNGNIYIVTIIGDIIADQVLTIN